MAEQDQPDFEAARQHHQAGGFDAAERLYAEVVERDPHHAGALHWWGRIALHQGRWSQAADLLGRAVAQAPRDAVWQFYFGAALKCLGRLDEAASAYGRALALNPAMVEAHNNLGTLLQQQGRLADAVACYAKALALKSDYLDALNNSGLCLYRLGRLEEAAETCRAILRLTPTDGARYHVLASILLDLGRLTEAEAAARQGLRHLPDAAELHTCLGTALLGQGRLPEAVISYRQAIQLAPDDPIGHTNLGVALKDLRCLHDALACLRRAAELAPGDPLVHNNLGVVLKDLLRFDEAVAAFRTAIALKGTYPEAHSNLLSLLCQLPDVSPAEVKAEAEVFGRAVAQAATPFTAWDCEAAPKRLRVGFVSADFHAHPVAYFLEGLWTHLDRSRIEIRAYSARGYADATTARLRQLASGWTALTGLSDAQAATAIHRDGVHILFDLSGHTARNRLGVFAWKPAPVQVSWLGYFATTGVAAIDYVLADPYSAPPAEDRDFTETLWRLPETRLCFTPPDVDTLPAPLPAMAAGRVTFGCFNNLAKLNDRVLALWVRVLAEVPGARLLLKTGQLSEPLVAEATRQRFAHLGLAPERLMLEGASPRADYLVAYGRIDIALDTFPYPGGTTSVEGLWMGVPVLTRAGDRFLAHQGEAIVRNAGLAEWIAVDDDDYVRKAVVFASDLDALAALRATLRPKVTASPLFNAPRFARHFDAALWGMWARSATGLKSASP